MTNYLEPEATATCLVSFCETLPFLAAGTTPAAGVSPSLSILHCRSENRRLFSAADCFSSPSPFASVAWSPSCPDTYLDGLIAGGLCNGGVAVWQLDGRHRVAMGPVEEAKPIVTLKGMHFGDEGEAPKGEQQVLHDSTMLSTLSDDEDDWDFDVDNIAWREGQPRVPGKEKWKPVCLASVKKIRDNKVHMVSPSMARMVGYFSDPRYTSAVRGVSFSPREPHILAAGTLGRLEIWDINNVSTSTSIRSWEYARSSTSVSGVSWNHHDKNLLAFVTREGTAALIDVRTKEATVNLITQFTTTRSLSSVNFSPHVGHLVAVSCDNDSVDPAVTVWDVRKLGKSRAALRHLCERSGGVRCLSWNRQKDFIIAGTSCAIQIYDDKEMVSLQPTDPCIDIAWSHVDPACFVVSYEKSLASYKLED